MTVRRLPETPSERGHWFALVAAVAVVGIVVAFYDLGAFRTLTKHEGFVAVVSREMMETGDWIVPRHGGLPRLKKPPLAYWTAAGASHLFGRHTEWTVRFPSAASALVLAGLVGFWAARWYGRPAGLAAALIQLTSVYVISFARKAEVDMQLCLLTTAALCLAGHAPERERRRVALLRWIAFYALLALSWNAKFHYGPGMVLSAVIAFFLVRREFRTLLWLASPPGLVIFAVGVAAWPYLLLQQIPNAWEIWRVETLGRVAGELGRHPFWYYVPQVVVQMLPWSPLLLRAVPESWQQAWRLGDRREQFIWVWFGTQFVLLGCSAFKHHHYLMAALPALALIMGRTLATLVEELSIGVLRIRRRQIVATAAASVSGGMVAALLIAGRWPHLANVGWYLGGLIAVGIPLAMWLAAAHRIAVAGGSAIAVFLGAYILVTGGILPGRDHRLGVVRFAQAVRNDVSDGRPVCVFGLKEDPVVYYLDDPVFRLESPDDLRRRVREQGRMLVLTQEHAVAELSTTARIRRLQQPTEYTDCPPSKEPPLVLLEVTPATMTAEQPETPPRTVNRPTTERPL